MYRKVIIYIVLTLAILTLATPVIASNPRVLQTSDPTPNNVIVFYDDYPTRGDANYQVTPTIAQPLVTHVDQNGKSTDWMFDSFIFYSYWLYYQKNPTQQYIDSWTSYLFDGMQVAKLDASVGVAKAALNQPSYQMMVFLSIPVAVENVTVPSILNNINSLINRWNNLGPNNLKLVGFYWGFTEDVYSVPNLQNIIPQVASYVHSLGLKMLMIPYQWPGEYAQLHSLGFDYVTLQPNYAFDSSDDLTLFTKTNDAITAGYVNGVELELSIWVTCCGGNWLTNLQTYLQQANQYQWYAKQPTVYYHGSDISVMGRSSNSTYRAAYDMIYQYVMSTRTAASTNSTITTTTSASTNTTTQSAPLPLNSLVTGVDAGSGSVSPNCPSGCQQQVGSSVLISAATTSGWTFSSWTVTGASCSGGFSSNPCTFTMPNNAVTLSATFTQTIVSSTATSVSSSIMTTLSSTTNSTVSSTTTSVSSSTAMTTVPTTSAALTTVILSPGNQTIVTSSPVRLLAQVTTGGTAVQGATVTVIVDGNTTCSGNSNSTGYFLCTYLLSQSGHEYTWYANASRLGFDSAKSLSSSFTFEPSVGTCAITYKLSDQIVGSSGRTASLLLGAQCSKSVGSYQFVIDLPLGSQTSSIGSPTMTGFMAGGSLLTSGAQLRWFNLNANGGTTGNLTIPILIASGLPSASNVQITLNSTTAIRDMAGIAMLLSPALPLSSSVNVIYPVATTTVYQALDAYFSNSVWSPIGRIPRVGDLYDLLDIYFTG